MTHDLVTLIHWLHIVVWIAAVCATLFPIIYAFSPWFSTVLGRVLMLQSVSFALALDVTLLFAYWHPDDILIIFWTDVMVFTLIAISTVALTFMLLRTNYGKYRLIKLES